MAVIRDPYHAAHGDGCPIVQHFLGDPGMFLEVGGVLDLNDLVNWIARNQKKVTYIVLAVKCWCLIFNATENY